MKNLAILLTVLITLFQTSLAHSLDGGQIVVSIKPLHSLVTSITGEGHPPTLLIRGQGSVHTYSLKPSDARALSKAKLVFWIGPQLETFLAKPLKTLAKNAKVITMAPDAHDPHIWLDPQKARKMAEQISSALIAADPQNAKTYSQNLQKTLVRIDNLDKKLTAQLAPVKPNPIFVFHNAWTHFSTRYELNIAGIFTHNAEIKPGARHLQDLSAKIKQQAANGKTCVFTEPQFNPKVVALITQNTGAGRGILDPLGSSLAPGPEQYFTMMHNLADALTACLNPQP